MAESKVKDLFDWNKGFDLESLCTVNVPPRIVKVRATPEAVPADGRSLVTLEAEVTDPQGLEDVALVRIDLRSIGGPSDALMYDNGTHGDGSTGDGIFSLQLAINPGVVLGAKSFPVTAVDRSGWEDEKELPLFVFQPNAPPIILSALAFPPQIAPGGKTVFAVKVADPEGLKDISRVTVELSPILGDSLTYLYDDGTHSDTKANDGIYMLETSISPKVEPGAKNIRVTVEDKGGGIAEGTIELTIVP
jgi:hypothetical protein